jgi:histidinol phosphatase-like enzyme (inositol monophosphatase family)
MSGEISGRLSLAIEVAREAGTLTLQYFHQANYRVERKDDQSPVTIADRRAELLLRERIQAAYPHDAIVGEEFDDVLGESGYRWILDPIDGTKSFICGVPLYGTLVGVELGSRCVIGVIRMPALDELVYASQGQGAWYQRASDLPAAPARVAPCNDLSDAVFVTSQVDTFYRRGAGSAFEQLQQSAQLTRTWGDCYGYVLLATGRAHLMVDAAMRVWDAAAIQPIIDEAGGVFCDWRGSPTIHSGEGVGMSAGLNDHVLPILRPFAAPKPSG